MLVTVLPHRWRRDRAGGAAGRDIGAVVRPARPGSPTARRRSERRSYLFRRESPPFEETSLPCPFPGVGGHRLAEALPAFARRPLGPERRVPVQGFPGCRGADAALPQLLADAPRAVAPADPRPDELLREPILVQEPLRLQRVEHPLDRRRIAAPRRELERELSACVLAAREQLERPRPELRIVIRDQAPTASPAPACSTEPLRPGRSRSRSAVSTACAASSCCLRNSRTLSRPWPMRSPP